MWNRLRCMLTQRLNRTMGKNDINIDEMQKMIRQGATLVDVRSPQEYKEGHLKKIYCPFCKDSHYFILLSRYE